MEHIIEEFKLIIKCVVDNRGHKGKLGWYSVAFEPNDKDYDDFLKAVNQRYGEVNVQVWDEDVAQAVYGDFKVIAFRSDLFSQE